MPALCKHPVGLYCEMMSRIAKAQASGSGMCCSRLFNSEIFKTSKIFGLEITAHER